MSKLPLRSESYASHFPSWDRLMPSIACVSVVICFADVIAPEPPAIGTIQMLARLRTTSYAKRVPSADSEMRRACRPAIPRQRLLINVERTVPIRYEEEATAIGHPRRADVDVRSVGHPD